MRAYGCTDGERLVGVFGVATDGVAARRLRRMGVPAASAGTSRLTLAVSMLSRDRFRELECTEAQERGMMVRVRMSGGW
ncbi:MAG: hypothetical protein J4F34_08155, partial [Gemmatimonadetes bacterium]|nr:hypothetical protein [Gemmatimonadota bacterium]